MYILILKYVKELAEIEKLIPDHREYLDKYYTCGNFIASGPQIPRNGGVILCRANSREEVKCIINDDPFLINGVAEYDITEFTPSKHLPEFDQFI